MKRYLLLAAFVFSFCTSLHAQKLEVRATIYSGLANFHGDAVVENTAMNGSHIAGVNGYTNNPYGKKAAFSAGAEVQAGFATKHGLLFNFSAGYESLATSVNINYMSATITSSLLYVPATGKTVNRSQFIDLFPSIGYRFKRNKIKVDLTAGIVIAPCISSREKGEAVAKADNNYRFNSDNKTNHPKTDIRPSLQGMVYYKKLGFVFGYQWGIKNYNDLLIGSDRQLEAFSRFLKLGLSYQIF